jgi:hypothetical protein
MKRKRRVKYSLPVLVSAISAVMSITPGPAHACDTYVQSTPYTVDSDTYRRSVSATACGQVDELGTYMEDLSAFGTSARFASTGVRGSSTHPAPPRAAPRPRTVDLAALRAWMRSPEFVPTDNLGTYMEDLSTKTVIATATARER